MIMEKRLTSMVKAPIPQRTAGRFAVDPDSQTNQTDKISYHLMDFDLILQLLGSRYDNQIRG